MILTHKYFKKLIKIQYPARPDMTLNWGSGCIKNLYEI